MKITFRKIVISILLVLSILAIHNFSNAVTVTTETDASKTFNKGTMLPQNNTAGATGMMPQYYLSGAVRNVTLPESRWNLNTNQWKATMDGKVVYCADYNSYVRYGKYDSSTHFFIPYGGTTIQGHTIYFDTWAGPTVKSQGNLIYNKLYEMSKDIASNYTYYLSEDGSVTSSSVTSLNDNGGVKYSNLVTEGVGFIIATRENGGFYNSIDQAKQYAQSTSLGVMNLIYNELGDRIKPVKTDDNSTDDSSYVQNSVSAIYGPEVVVMETTNHASNGYQETGGTTYSNNKNAFIFSASENAYGSKDYASKYTLNDIQGAYWKVLQDEGGEDPSSRITQNAIELYNKATAYEAFNGKFSATINNSSAQVIVDRNNGEYIIGPYSINYTMIEDISYIKALSINDSESLTYDEKHSGIQLVLDGIGTKVVGSNGIEKEYPRSGQNFFIKFSAAQAGYPTNVSLDVRFEYISNTKATVDTELKANANVYQYMGHVNLSGDYSMNIGNVSLKFTYLVGDTEQVKVHDGWTEILDENGNLQREELYHYETRYFNVERTAYHEVFTAYQPYIKMNSQPKTGDAQELIVVGDASRDYTIVKKSINIDLTMNLGGIVWEDSESGKESISNGKRDGSEKRIPNVIVTLYKSDGTIVETPKITDNNGEYRFTGLNAMYTYYVKFTYNGQYYQPTTYSSSSTWGTSGWRTNSNATDKKNERESYNIKFEKIESSPINYKGAAGYNETFTKQELLGYTLNSNGEYVQTRQPVIDEFGNLILESSNDSVTQKMIQYVKDCRMDAYTGNGNGGYEVYPTPSLFVIDNKPVTREYMRVFNNSPAILYDNAYYINLGLNPRQQSDLAVKKDVEKVTLEINGQQHIYTYDTLENKENAENTWDISLRLSDVVSNQKYYNTNYSREIYTSDYLYKVSNYGANFADYGKAKSDELEVYITYKIMVRNQAMSIQARVDEIVDYYDTDLEYIDGRSYIEITRGNNAGKYLVQASGASRYESISKDTRTTINGYDNLYIRGLSNGAQLIDEKGNTKGSPIADGIYLEAGQTAYVYLTFRVEKDSRDGEEWVRLDEEIETAKAIGVGKENIVELNSYSTRYAKGTMVPNVGDVSYKPAGIVDRDSNPGNLSPTDVPKDGQIKYENFEDDTDKAPNIRIILNRDDNAVRVISGSIWEDIRNETIEVTATGDGIRDSKDKTLINGVTVQLVELMENGTEYVWREFGDNTKETGEYGGTNTIGKGTGSGTISSETPIINSYNLVKNYNFEGNHSGAYAFKSFMPGKYVVRFIYGDTVRTVTPSSLNMGGLNGKSYNGQDFKSTTYQQGIEQNKVYTWREQSTWLNGQETLGNILTEVSTFKADASNNETANAKTNELKAYLYDITASDKKTNVSDAKDIESRRNEVINYSDNDITNYIAEVLASHKSDYSTMNDRNTLLNDLMANTKMTAETGLMVIEFEYDTAGTDGNKKDNTYKIQNVDLGLEERPKAQLAIDKEVTNVKLTLADGSILFDAKNTASNVLWRDHKAYSVGYVKNLLDEDKFGNIENIRNKNSSKFGLIQLTMDEELMHGATMEITYQITVSNVGEVDYKDNLFYYTGNKSANAQIVTTRADKVIDYVANNLQFNVSNNSNWKVIEKDAIKSQGLVHEKLSKQVEKFNTIIETESLNKDLVPNLYKDKLDKNSVDSVSVPLVLTQLITSENDSDDLTYRNLVEIVKTSNTVGRRMEYSVVGNQDPEKTPQELDSDIAEVVRILPPFGNAGIYITIALITLVALTIVIGGTIFIKKKVLRK